MELKNLRYEIRDAIALVTINRPKVLNAMDLATLEELRQCFTVIQSDSAVRAAILTGAGEKAFVAGADLNEIAGLNPLAAGDYSRRGQAILDLIENLGKPVIACVNGFALGGGCELAMACTLRLAAENAQFGLPEVKLGIIPGFGGTQRLPRLVGKGPALGMLLTGEMISAAEAYRIGLANQVMPASELLARAEEIARKIMANAPLAVQCCLEAVNHGSNLHLAEAQFLESSLFANTCASEDKAEGTSAFLQKRPPRFQGR